MIPSNVLRTIPSIRSYRPPPPFRLAHEILFNLPAPNENASFVTIG